MFKLRKGTDQTGRHCHLPINRSLLAEGAHANIFTAYLHSATTCRPFKLLSFYSLTTSRIVPADCGRNFACSAAYIKVQRRRCLVVTGDISSLDGVSLCRQPTRTPMPAFAECQRPTDNRFTTRTICMLKGLQTPVHSQCSHTGSKAKGCKVATSTDIHNLAAFCLVTACQHE